MVFKVLARVQDGISSVCTPTSSALTSSEAMLDQMDIRAARMKHLGRVQGIDYDVLAKKLTEIDPKTPIMGPTGVEEGIAE